MSDEIPARARPACVAWICGAAAGLLFLGGVAALLLMSPERAVPETAVDVAPPVSSLKAVVASEECYKSTSGSAVYASLTQLSSMVPPYVDTVLGGGKKSGYCFTLGNPADADWAAKAEPVAVGKTGCRRFFVNSSGVIRFALNSPNESWGLAGLKSLVTAEAQYRSLEKPGTYASLSQLSATAPPYVDGELGAGRKGGYSFVLSVGTPADSGWRATAGPIGADRGEGRFFYADERGIIRCRDGAPAGPSDPPAKDDSAVE